jgi:hypothetical protein
MNETHILIRLLRVYIPRNWEFGSALAKLRILRGVRTPQTSPPLLYATGYQLRTNIVKDEKGDLVTDCMMYFGLVKEPFIISAVQDAWGE